MSTLQVDKVAKMILGVTTVLAIIFCNTINAKSADLQQVPYEADWESLSSHQAAPEWLQDAKVGIYFHWGVYSVPAFHREHYPRLMYMKGHKERGVSVYDYHKKTYGKSFDYHDFIKSFTAEHFDAEEWVSLFKQAGARFAGPVAEHHDGFSMWASEVTPWNAGDMGPKRDIVGELATALRTEGMKLITTFHHSRNLQRYADRPDETRFGKSHYPYVPGTATASDDPKLRLLYGNMPEDEWLETIWFGKLKEVINNYQPDIIWFDSWLGHIPETYRQKFCAYYLNAARSWDREVVIARKHNDLPIDFTVNNLEKSRMTDLSERVWMTDDTVSTFPWSYTHDLELRQPSNIIHSLIDTVSKNGIFLLNISPRSDGTIPKGQRKILQEMGKWLDQNGEAIYETRPWLTYGEGTTQEPRGGFSAWEQFLKLEYGANDIRYTASKDRKTLYAIILDWPEMPELAFGSVRVIHQTSQAKVSLIGYPETIGFRIDNLKRLILSVPQLEMQQRPGEHAYVFKIEGFDLRSKLSTQVD